MFKVSILITIVFVAVFAVFDGAHAALSSCSCSNTSGCTEEAYYALDCSSSGTPGDASQSGTGVTLKDPLGGKGFNDIANGIIDFIFTLSIPLVAILVLFGGFQMITSAGDPTKFSNGKKTILYAVIGFAVVIFAKGITATIKSLLGAN